MTIIGLVGRSGSGKDTVAAYIAPVHLVRIDGSLVDIRTKVKEEQDEERHIGGNQAYHALLSRVKSVLGVTAGAPSKFTFEPLRPHAAQVALADPMKVFLKQVYGWSYLTLWGSSEHRNQTDVNGVNPRKALQQLGTEWGRAMWDGTWVSAGIRFARELTDKQHIKKPISAHTFAPNWIVGRYDLVVFSDIRFQNEVDMIHTAGGHVWRINRPVADGATVAHASEVQDLTGIDREIDNGGTLGDLYAQTSRYLGEAQL